jgi:hypothetical protein
MLIILDETVKKSTCGAINHVILVLAARDREMARCF